MTATLCLTLAVLLGSAGLSWSADFQKGWKAFQEENYATALEEFLPLAKQGHELAQYNLGVMYREGRGVKKSNVDAVRWWTKAALASFAPAQANLGLMFDKGEGVQKDSKTAVKLFKYASEKGNLIGQHNLGLNTTLGQGTPKDVVIGHMWLNIASLQGHKPATKAKRILERSMMTPAQIAEAQNLARKCILKELKGC